MNPKKASARRVVKAWYGSRRKMEEGFAVIEAPTVKKAWAKLRKEWSRETRDELGFPNKEPKVLGEAQVDGEEFEIDYYRRELARQSRRHPDPKPGGPWHALRVVDMFGLVGDLEVWVLWGWFSRIEKWG